MSPQVTSQDFWSGALFAGIMSLFLALPLIVVYKNPDFQRSSTSITLSSAVFWGALAFLAFFRFWKIYYQYIYPGWMRWLAPLDILLYAAFGLGFWWIATHLPGSMVLWFLLLGGLESIGEHLVGIYFLGILDKVPMFQGVKPLPALVFAFFEYIVYWAIVAWMSFALYKLLNIIKPSQ